MTRAKSDYILRRNQRDRQVSVNVMEAVQVHSFICIKFPSEWWTERCKIVGVTVGSVKYLCRSICVYLLARQLKQILFQFTYMHGLFVLFIFPSNFVIKTAACPGQRLICLYASLEGLYSADAPDYVNWFVAVSVISFLLTLSTISGLGRQYHPIVWEYKPPRDKPVKQTVLYFRWNNSYSATHMFQLMLLQLYMVIIL